MRAAPVDADQAGLSERFLDWWFAPWTYLHGALLPGLTETSLARRDGYRAWCASAGLPPDLPVHFESAWQSAANDSGPGLRLRAGLFGGLFAARTHDQSILKSLTRQQQAWCMSVSLAQPLTSCVASPAGPATQEADAPLLGLAELAWRLEQGFPGLWPRLRCLLAQSERDHIEHALRTNDRSGQVQSAAAARRALRCWQICCARAALDEAA